MHNQGTKWVAIVTLLLEQPSIRFCLDRPLMNAPPQRFGRGKAKSTFSQAVLFAQAQQLATNARSFCCHVAAFWY